jgi:hypothetical protein
MADGSSRFPAPWAGPTGLWRRLLYLIAGQKTGEFPMPEYVAGLCRMQGSELVGFETKEFSADNHDEAVRQALEWFLSTNATIDDRTWLQVICDGSAFFSKEIGQL